MFNKDCFVVANGEEKAWARIYSISKKELIFEKNYSGIDDFKALISKDKTKMYIAYTLETDSCYLSFVEIISLIDFSVIKTIELPEHYYIKCFALGSNNRLLFYYVIEDPHSHGYDVINEITEKTDSFPM